MIIAGDQFILVKMIIQQISLCNIIDNLPVMALYWH